MDGAFVGTWRPHRSQGLISAQFTSPGPKYSVQGTTGYINHNSTKVKAPAYTCREAKAPVEGGCSPGPRYYVEPSMARTGKYIAPAYARGCKSKQSKKSLPMPPPTCTRRAVWFLNPLPSSLNWCILCQAQTPGPAVLPKIKLDVFKTRAPGYTMGTRSQLWDKTVKLGLADYPTGRVELIKPQAPAATFGLRHSVYTTPLILDI
ncbi:ciliary microtubule associated protein 1A-like [Patagioenas fasciata]|uniref:ciliary microtubule associated protein 1A-like n=1 Tax=Patagioenas fasciata TaxID=372321 RepID=UPI0032E8BE17